MRLLLAALRARERKVCFHPDYTSKSNLAYGRDYARADQRRLADEREETFVVGKDRNWRRPTNLTAAQHVRDLDVIFERRGDAVAVEAAFDRDRGLSHQPQRPRRQPGDPAARTGSPFANGPAEPEGCAKRDRARYGRRDVDRNPSERVRRRRGAGPVLTLPWSRPSSCRRREIIQRLGEAQQPLRAMRTKARDGFIKALRDAHRWLDELLVDPTQTIELLAIREGKSVGAPSFGLGKLLALSRFLLGKATPLVLVATAAGAGINASRFGHRGQ